MWFDEPLTLASGSETRRAILHAAGLNIAVAPPRADIERRAKAEYSGLPEFLPQALAAAKAAAIAVEKTGLVLGADQILLHEGRVFDKPRSRLDAVAALRDLSGSRHQLISGLSLWRDNKEIWSYSERAGLTIRQLTAEDIEAYLDRVGDKAFTSVGAYQVEGPGIQLFDAIDGDHFTILGLPLLPLLAFLRRQAAEAKR
jgi:septum formation protein